MNIKLGFVLGVLLTVLNVGSSLKCYHCGSLEVTATTKLDGCQANREVVTCPSRHVCSKALFTDPQTGIVAIGRGCDPKVSCDMINRGQNAECYSCESDLCNSSTALVPSVAALAIIIVFKFFV